MPINKDSTAPKQRKRYSKSTRQGDSVSSCSDLSRRNSKNIFFQKPRAPEIPHITPSKTKYEFYLNNSDKNVQELFYKNNQIDTTKYNIFTFIPKALFFQFLRLANIYFLAIAIIQCIPIISPLGPVTAILPLVFVLCVSLVREGIEDMARARMDKEQNEEQVYVYRDKHWMKIASGDLNMGEIVLVKKDESFPADLVLLDSTLPEGICFIETGTLDGEKTLKLKSPPSFTKGKFTNPSFFKGFEGLLQEDSTNNNQNENEQQNMEDENNISFDLQNKEHNNNVIMEMENEEENPKKPQVRKKLLTGTKQGTNRSQQSNPIPINSDNKTRKSVDMNIVNGLQGISPTKNKLGNKKGKLKNNLSKNSINSLNILKQDLDETSSQRSRTSQNKLLKEETKKKKTAFIDISGYCQCDLPNAELYQLNGKMIMLFNEQAEEFPLDAKQLLLKGAKLRNTEWIIGIIIYSGHNCKLLKNAKNPLVKYSTLEKLMNKLLVFILLIQTLLSIVSAITQSLLYKSHLKHAEYIETSLSETIQSVLTFFTYFLLLNTMIPISLIVTLEIVKIAQGLFLGFDLGNFSIIRNRFAKVNSCSLNEELGMVDFIFSDKTGTLTCNKMALKFNVISDQCYEFIREGEDPLKNQKLRKDENIHVYHNYQMLDIDKHQLGFNKSLTQYKVSSEENPSCSFYLDSTKKVCEEYWQALALCHDCSIQNGEIIGMSPDSIELVKTAKLQGYEFVEAESNAKVVLQIGNENQKKKKEFEKLMNIEFSSDRKRESIIVMEKNGLIKLYIKGADSIIEERLNQNLTPKAVLEKTRKFVSLFSAQGYRTLYIGMRVLSQKEYELFTSNLNEAQKLIEGKEEKVKEAYAMVEKNITLLGATIVEDKLQDKVPETIKELRVAGIKIWMLTGDKMNTAYNIGLSCNLISKEMKTFFIEGKAPEKDSSMKVINNPEREQVILDFAKEYQSFKGNFDSMTSPKFALVVDEKALLTITENESISKIFLDIAKNAVAVICCRVSPLQKSQVVKMMKNFDQSKVTLAIGDGGNDVSMIMEAHIGIGIYGEEGLRAVQSSDYAIGEFKVLKRLLLYHGSTNLMRNSELILYFFYKNFVFTIVHFFFGFYNNFSGQTIIDDWFITCFNLVFTSLPLGVRAILDIDFRPSDSKVVEKNMPYLYLEGRDYPRFTPLKFVVILLKGIIQGLINFIVTIYSIRSSQLDDDGNFNDLWYISVVLYTNILLIVTNNLLLNTKYHTFLNIIFVLCTTIFLYMVFLIAVQNFSLFNSYCTMIIAFGNGKVYVTILLVVGLSFLIDFAFICYENVVVKSIRNIIKANLAVITDENELEKKVESNADFKRLKKKYDGVGMEDILSESIEEDQEQEQNEDEEEEEEENAEEDEQQEKGLTENGGNYDNYNNNNFNPKVNKNQTNKMVLQENGQDNVKQNPANNNKKKGRVSLKQNEVSPPINQPSSNKANTKQKKNEQAKQPITKKQNQINNIELEDESPKIIPAKQKKQKQSVKQVRPKEEEEVEDLGRYVSPPVQKKKTQIPQIQGIKKPKGKINIEEEEELSDEEKEEDEEEEEEEEEKKEADGEEDYEVELEEQSEEEEANGSVNITSD